MHGATITAVASLAASHRFTLREADGAVRREPVAARTGCREPAGGRPIPAAGCPVRASGKRSALGVGICVATAEILLLADSDKAWEPGLPAAVQAPFENPRVGGVGTRQSVYLPRTSAWRRVANWMIDVRYLDYVPSSCGPAPSPACPAGPSPPAPVRSAGPGAPRGRVFPRPPLCVRR